MNPDQLPQRIRDKFDVDESGCWLWRKPSGGGYGYIHWGKMRKATRVIWELLVGPIPEGLVLDHLCRVTACVNPEHLEIVTQTDNMRRGRNPNREKTHCPQGHPYDKANTIVAVSKGRKSRYCRTCQREYIRRWKQRKREEKLRSSVSRDVDVISVPAA